MTIILWFAFTCSGDSYLWLLTDFGFSLLQLHMQYECNRKKKWSRCRRRISFCYQKPSKILLYSDDAQIFQTFFQRGDLVWRPDSYVRSGQWKELYWTHATQMLFCILKLLYAGTGHLFSNFSCLFLDPNDFFQFEL